MFPETPVNQINKEVFVFIPNGVTKVLEVGCQLAWVLWGMFGSGKNYIPWSNLKTGQATQSLNCLSLTTAPSGPDQILL